MNLAFCGDFRFHRRMKYPMLLAVVFGLAGFAQAMSQKPKASISFHTPGSDMESPRSIFRIMLPGTSAPTIFHKVPEFSNHDIAAFHSFPASDGNGNGLTLKLDFRGASSLELLTRSRQGDILLPIVNGMPLEPLNIDTAVTDGLITIWSGVPDSVIKELGKKYPPISQLASVSNADPNMIGTTRKEKERVMEDYREKAEHDRIAGNKAVRKAIKDANSPTGTGTTNPAEPQLPITAPSGSGLPVPGTVEPAPRR